MSKARFKFLPFILFGLITTSATAHAEGSLLDSINKKITDASKTISDKIKKYYGDTFPTTPTTPAKIPVSEPVKPRELTPVEVTRANLSQCQKFLGYLYSPNYETDPKKVATIYLNAVLDFTALNFNAKPSEEEIDERNKCVELALNEGADPNSNGQEKRDDDLMFAPAVPLSRAVRNNDEVAVKMLLDHKADPNIKDSSFGNPVPLINSSIYNASQEIAVELINAGADLTTTHLLWIAAGNAADKVVELLIESNKIPVNQLNKFSDYGDEEGITALDTSESNLFALKTYQNKFATNSKLTLQEKIAEANRILYYHYPLKPQLKISENSQNSTIDPDAFINDLLNRQQTISNSLKAAGGTCKQENCGIIDLSSND
jgi:hypothetical protein